MAGTPREAHGADAPAAQQQEIARARPRPEHTLRTMLDDFVVR